MARWSPRAALARVLPVVLLCLVPVSSSFAQSPAAPAGPAGTGVLVLQPGPEGKDAGVESPYPDQNYGAHDYLYGIGLPWYGIGYIEFDLSSLPADAVVTAATLDLWGRYMDGTLTFDAAAGTWAEMSVTWNTRPAAVSPSLAVTYPISRGPASGPCYMGCVQAFDVTDIVAAWVSHSIPNHGFLIVGNTPGYGWMIATGENSSVPRPRLWIQYDSSLPAAASSWGQLKALYR